MKENREVKAKGRGLGTKRKTEREGGGERGIEGQKEGGRER